MRESKLTIRDLMTSEERSEFIKCLERKGFDIHDIDDVLYALDAALEECRLRQITRCSHGVWLGDYCEQCNEPEVEPIGPATEIGGGVHNS